jgi:hypothetical protein
MSAFRAYALADELSAVERLVRVRMPVLFGDRAVLAFNSDADRLEVPV